MKPQIPLVRLGYLATIQSGITVDANREVGPDSVTLPYLRVANVQDGYVDLDSVSEITVPESVAQSATLQRGDVLMTEGGDLDKLGRGTAWRGQIPRCLHQNHVFAVRPDRRLLHPEYLALITRTGYARSYFESTGTKTTNLASTNSSKIRDFRVPLVDLDIQISLSNFLEVEIGRIERLRNLRARARAVVESRTVAHVDHLFDDLTRKYGNVPFGRMIRSVEQGISPQCENFPAENGTWGVLKISAIKAGMFTGDENKRLPDNIPPDRRYEIKHGDLLITRANTPLLVGSVAIADRPRSKLMLCDKIFRIVTTSFLIPEFLAFAALSTRIRAMCASASHGTSQSMVNLRAEEVKRWPVPAAPLTAQREAIAELREARDRSARLAAAIDRQLSVFSERQQASITAAVAGQLDSIAGGATA